MAVLGELSPILQLCEPSLRPNEWRRIPCFFYTMMYTLLLSKALCVAQSVLTSHPTNAWFTLYYAGVGMTVLLVVWCQGRQHSKLLVCKLINSRR